MEPYQKEYIRKMSARIDAIDSALQAYQQDDPEAEASLRRMSHSLRGSGGTFGFPQISTLAAAVEDGDATNLVEQTHNLLLYLRFLHEQVQDQKHVILVVDDSDEIQLMLKSVLENQGYNVLSALTAGAAEEILQTDQVSLIILDLVLPDTDGRNFLLKLREETKTATTPVLVLSAKNSSQTKAECLALGADQYFEKPIDMGLLATAVANHLERARKIRTATHVDQLTGLANRAAFIERYNEILPGQETVQPVTLAVLDIDRFKRINDLHGHIVGDEVLLNLAKRLKGLLGPRDLAARWGGEEFVLLFLERGAGSARDLLDDLQNSLASEPVSKGKTEAVHISFSAGCIELTEELEVRDAIATADMLMYHAKEAGRKQVYLDSASAKPVPRRILLAEDDDLTATFISHRLEKSGFDLVHYASGDEACEAGTQNQFDLIITDVKMPGMDGFELVQRLRSDSLNKGTPILMLTSMGREQDIARGLGLGANDYMLKPFSPTELLARVSRLLKA